MKKRPVNVFVGHTSVGMLTRSDVAEETTLFGYRDGTLPANAVSLTMPVRVDQYDSMGGLLPIFEMNLPEGILKERLRVQFAKAIPEFDDLDMLAIVGSSQIGRIRYSEQDQIDPNVPQQDIQEILTYEGTADLFAHLLERFATYSGISGIQPKVLVRDEQVPSKVTHRGATHIAKRISDFVSPNALADAREQYALMVAYACTVGNGDAHLKNFSVLYRHAEATVELAPAYDLVSTKIYMPGDSLALTMRNSKEFPDRAELVRFVRLVTGKTQQSAARLLDQVRVGTEAAIKEAKRYAKQYKDADAFTTRLVNVIREGMERLVE
jgi:HipA-like protein